MRLPANIKGDDYSYGLLSPSPPVISNEREKSLLSVVSLLREPYEERFLSSQTARFARAKRERESRLAPFEMTCKKSEDRNVSKETRESVIEMGTEGAGRLVRKEQGN